MPGAGLHLVPSEPELGDQANAEPEVHAETATSIGTTAGDGAVAAASGFTLCEALTLAEAAPGLDRIEFDASIAGQTAIPGGRSAPGATASVFIPGDIDGYGDADVAISALSAAVAEDASSGVMSTDMLGATGGANP